MYAVTGATGNTGGVLAEELLSHNQRVRVIGRDSGRLGRFAEKGAESFVADITDAAALTKAFAGTQAVYLMVPPNLGSPDPLGYEERATDAMTAAVKNAGVEYAVVLSSVGADKPEKTGPVRGLYKFEQKLNGISGLNAVYLRAGYFMENLLPQVQAIQNMGSMGGPVRGDLALPMIATRDIGIAAAEALRALDFSGKQIRELLGQRDVSYLEAAPVIGKAIGKPDLGYVQLPNAQLKPFLLQAGMSSAMADLLFEMTDSLNSGYMAALEPRSARNTTPTSIEEFAAKIFAPRFSGKTAGAH